MRTIVDLPDDQVDALRRLTRSAQISRAELVRRAVAEYLARHTPPAGDEAFGLWRRRHQDGLVYQEQMRSEWDE